MEITVASVIGVVEITVARAIGVMMVGMAETIEIKIAGNGAMGIETAEIVTAIGDITEIVVMLIEIGREGEKENPETDEIGQDINMHRFYIKSMITAVKSRASFVNLLLVT